MTSSHSNDAGNEMDWQSGTSTVQDRLKHIWETGVGTDVQFLLGTGKEKADGKEEKQIIKAHRLILSMSSSIFAAQFRFGEFVGQDKDVPIEVKDFSASAFNAMVNFLYTNDISLINDENIVGVYSAAKKYFINALVQKCIELTKLKFAQRPCGIFKRTYFTKVETLLCEKNVIEMLRMAKLHEDKIMIEHCWEYIDRYIVNMGSDILLSNKEEMGELLARDTLRCAEFALFGYLVKWATKQCENEGILEPNGKQLRAKMGQLLYGIRFPLILPMDFIKFIVPKGILNNSAISAMLLHYSQDANVDNKLPFSAQPRAYPPREHKKLMDKFVTEEEKMKLMKENEQLKKEIERLRGNK